MSEKAVRFVKNGLLAFVLITVGFALGKETALRSAKRSSPEATIQATRSQFQEKSKVIVYYMHATIRCVTCNTMEQMTEALLKSQFSDALADGRIEWKQASFQEEEELAKKYGIISSCVVVVQTKEGKETGYKRLDEIWTLMENKTAFEKYVGNAIREYLPEEKKGGQAR